MTPSGRTESELRAEPSDERSRLARALAPEDIRRGDCVAVLDETHEFPSYWWCADTTIRPPEQPIRIRILPHDEAVPLRVVRVCLPFVLAKHPHGKKRTLDVRRVRLARLDRGYAAAAWKAYKRKRQPPAAV